MAVAEQDGSGGQYRSYESAGLNLLQAAPKVLEILDGKIPPPEVVEIFPTNFCDLHCPHCRFKDVHGNRQEYMELTTLDGLLTELSTRGVNTVELSGGGEPLMHPQVEEMLDMFINHNFRLGIITNGQKLVESPEIIDKLIRCADWVRFSLDAFTDETYKKVHGSKNSSYTALREAIAELIGKAGRTPKVGLKILISILNAQDTLLAIPEAIELKADFVQFKFLGSPARLVLGDEKTKTLSGQIRSQIAEVKRGGPISEVVPPYKGEADPNEKCLMTYLHAVVDWDGAMYICAFFENRKNQHSLGNIRDGGFFKIWGDPKHHVVFENIDSRDCVSNCPMLRYNPVIEFIKTDNYRFKYI